jgi:carbonic anhydrase
MSKAQANPGLSRRSVLQGVLAAAALAAVPRSIAALPPDNNISPSAALDRLVAGNARYMKNQMERKDFSAGRAATSESQHPIAAILGCADSRVSPELIFDQGLGDLFVCRLAGNYVNVDVLASLEYGTAELGAPLVMVLGHSNCGAVKAMLHYAKDPEPLPGHLQMMLDSVRPGIATTIKQSGKEDGKEILDQAVEENVRYNVDRLRLDHPVIAKAVNEKRIDVVGGVYTLSTGQVRVLR